MKKLKLPELLGVERLLGGTVVQVERAAPDHPACRAAELCPGCAQEHLAGIADLCRFAACDGHPADCRRDFGRLGFALGPAATVDRAGHAVRFCLSGVAGLGRRPDLVDHRLHWPAIQLEHRARPGAGTAARPRPAGAVGGGQFLEEHHGHDQPDHRLLVGRTVARPRHPRPNADYADLDWDDCGFYCNYCVWNDRKNPHP